MLKINILICRLFFLIILTTTMLADNTIARDFDSENRKIIEKFFEQRQKMMEEMMKAFDDDDFFKQSPSFDIDSESLFNQLRNNGLSGLKELKGESKSIQVEEKIQADGTIDIIITPKREDTNFNIETTDHLIKISSELNEKRENKSNSSQTSFISSASFSRSISIPDGYSAQKPKKVGKSIIIKLTPNKDSILKPGDDGKVPVQKRRGEKVI